MVGRCASRVLFNATWYTAAYEIAEKWVARFSSLALCYAPAASLSA